MPEHARQKIWKHLLRRVPAPKDLSCLGEIEGIPRRVIAPIQRDFKLMITKIVKAQTSKDGSTTKLLVRLQDGMEVETVIIRHGATTAEAPRGSDRTTLCVSSQIGCKMGCKFCATGTMGELGNLTCGEICEQLIHARRWASVRNIVFMGMGEPFRNYDEVAFAVRAMIDRRRFGLAPKHVTVSTVGVVPRMRQFMKDFPSVHLALSLHAPTQEMRKSFVPAAGAYSLEDLMGVVDEYTSAKRRMLLEYVLLKGVNDSAETARTLGALLKGRNCTLNIIPYNPTDVTMDCEAPSADDVNAFMRIVHSEFGVLVLRRREMGQDIDGACGQLSVKASKARRAAVGTGDIEDIIGKSPSGAGSEQYGKLNATPEGTAMWGIKGERPVRISVAPATSRIGSAFFTAIVAAASVLVAFCFRAAQK